MLVNCNEPIVCESARAHLQVMISHCSVTSLLNWNSSYITAMLLSNSCAGLGF